MGAQGVKLLLDSVILIDHFNGIPAATEYLESTGWNAAISVITRAEVLTGFDDDAALAAGRALLDFYHTLIIDQPVADLAAALRKSKRWKLPDAFQAALAQHHGLRLVTRNTKDFSPEIHDFVLVPYTLNP